MVCEKCGLPLLGTEVFCPQCGAQVEPAPAAAAEPPVEPAAPAPEEPLASRAEAEPPVVEAADVPLVATFDEETTEAAEPAPKPAPVQRRASTRRAAPKPRPAAPVTPVQPPALAPTVPARPAPAPTAQPRATIARRSRRLMGPLGLGVLAGCLLFFVVGLGSLGVYQGLRMRAQNQNEVAARHYAQGLVHLQKGEYELAAAEFEWALRLRPNYPEAEEKLIEARSKASGQPTPVSPPPQGKAPTLLIEGRTAYDRGAWDETIQKLEAVQAADPNYEQALVQRLLVGAYTNGGLKLVNEDRLEEAIRYFNQALTLQPDNPDVQAQLRLATLYQSALTIWGVDWQQAIKRFSALYALKPDYKDTAQRLQQANVQAGDVAGAQAAWCDALQFYKAALALASSPDLAAKRDDAAQRCASPTSVPGTPVPAGTFVGTYGGQEDIHYRTSDWARVQGHVLNAKGEGVPGIQVRLSAYDWSATQGTDNTGYYQFEFLNNELTFTVTLVGLPVQPVDVMTKFGYASVADFTEKQ